jgi:hypothetical protein
MWVVYTRSTSDTKVVSRLISWFTKKKNQLMKHTPSHMQFVFGKRFSLESVGSTGVRIGFFPKSIEHNDVIAVFDYYDKSTRDGIMLAKGAFKYHGAKYDYMAIMYFAFYIARKKMFGIDLPEVNKKDNSKRFFCSEMMEFIEETSFRESSPNDQMLDLFEKPEKFECIYDARTGENFDEWFKEEFEVLMAKINK